MTTPPNRFVVGPDAQGRSAVLTARTTNVQSRRGSTGRPLWATQETPADKHDPTPATVAKPDLGETSSTRAAGLFCRALEISTLSGFPCTQTKTTAPGLPHLRARRDLTSHDT